MTEFVSLGMLGMLFDVKPASKVESFL